MKKKVSLITGINGQDGYYLAQLLLEKNYKVIGLSRKPVIISDKVEYIQGDLIDTQSLHSILENTKPDEIYNLASQSHPHKSWDKSVATAEINALGAHRLFETAFSINPDCKIFQASSSQIFGDTSEEVQHEDTSCKPINPYAISKLYAHNIAKSYRKNYRYFISCGILYNHESPVRGMHFITQKVTYAAACIKQGIKESNLLNEQGEPIVKNGKLYLGNLNAVRDWGHAADYVKAMWMMLQHHTADDFIVATGINHSVRDLCNIAFSHVRSGLEKYIETDDRLIRPLENSASADITKIKTMLSWEPQINFKQLITGMVDFHLNTVKSG